MKRIAFIGYIISLLGFAWLVGGCPPSSTIKDSTNEVNVPDANTAVSKFEDASSIVQPRPRPPVIPSKTAKAWFEDGVRISQKGQTDEAIKAFQSALTENPKMYQAWYNIGVLNDRQNNSTASERAYQNALRLKPSFYEAAINLSRLYLRLRRKTQATSLLEQKASQFPKDLRFRNALIYMHIYSGQLQRSEQMARAIQRKHEKNVETIMNLGLVWYKQKKYELARMAFNIAKRAKRKAAEPRYYLGFTYMKLGNISEAKDAFKDAIQRRDAYPEAHNALGALQLKTSKVTQAIASFRKAIQYMPNFWEAQVNLGIALRQNQKINEALDQFIMIKTKNPYNIEAHYYLGILYLDHNLTKGRLQPARFLSSVPQSIQREKAIFRQGQKIARYATASQYLQSYISRKSGLSAIAPVRKYLADAQKKQQRAEKGLKGMVKRFLKRRLRKLKKAQKAAARRPAPSPTRAAAPASR